VSGARITQMVFDQRAQSEALVQLTREQQPSIGGHGGSAELDAKLGVEREPNRARCRVTHWSRHPLDDALRTSEEPPRAAFLAGATRLWSDPFASQNANMGLVERPTLRTLQRISARIGAKTTQRILGRGASRWVPIVGALGVAGYAYYDTRAVGQTAMDLFGKDIDGGAGSPPPEVAPQPRR
jgi:hypothetical protein